MVKRHLFAATTLTGASTHAYRVAFRMTLCKRLASNLHDASSQELHSENDLSGDESMSASRESTVGFVGLGMMGGPMAKNILNAGHTLVVYDVDPNKVDRCVALGARPADAPDDVGRQASIVVTMVDTTAQAEEVITGARGVVASAQAGDVIVSMSTIDPAALKKMRETLVPHGADLIDAPVSGMERGAHEGTLKAFVGGTPEALERVRPVLQAMTSEIIHFGPIGQGTTMKLVNNMLVQVAWISIAEALALGAKAGLDPKQMVDVIGNATGNSIAFQYSAPRILAREFDGIRMDITYKDIELQTSLAKALQVPMFIANVAQQVYQMGRAAGLGGEDGGSAIVKIYEQMTGVKVTG
ncbi:NAD(P)-dependent oxidoreductase [Paraburkholderia kirstenboschensis]|uniref:NAD(P)-dependent oxidoreductase n=1 Tax=Paraburkholderia kirstenboschensis TaxID=1245436 RepID=A0ABZ0EC60_9BURK|nr:NAD(P)-dependent oxidoreductase [Paraburkholderia kirstenboschensis]WOD14099.1 NAD(P)-dependent oxidoreductase [Paraburkholderia kirstenboschensis]